MSDNSAVDDSSPLRLGFCEVNLRSCVPAMP